MVVEGGGGGGRERLSVCVCRALWRGEGWRWEGRWEGIGGLVPS